MNSSVIKNSVSTFITSIITIPIGFVTSILIARLLGPTGKGSFDLLLATSALLGIIIGFSLPTGVTYLVAKKNVSFKKLVFLFIPIIIIQGILASCLLYIADQAKISSAFLPPDHEGRSVYLIFLIIIITTVMSYLRAIIIGKQLISTLNFTDILLKSGFFVFLIFIWGSSYWFNYTSSAYTISIGYLSITAFTILLLIRKLTSLATSFKSEEFNISEIIRYSVPCYFSNVIQFLNYRLDVFLVSLFIGTAGLGIYTLSVSISQLIWLSSNAIATTLFPAIASSQHNPKNNAIQTAQIARLVFFFSIVLAIIFACLAPLIPVFFGNDFRQSVQAFLWLLPGITIFTNANILASFFAGIGKPHKNLIVSTTGVLFSIVLNLLLIPRWGIVGASITSSISYTISTILLMIFFVQETQIPIFKLFLVERVDFTTAYRKLLLNYLGNRQLP